MLAWLPDEPALYDKLTAWEYLEFIAGLWGVDAKTAAPRAEELLKFLGLWDNRDERTEGFSRGMKQKTALAGALIHDPKLLMLDEPLTGLDAAVARQVKDLLQQRAKRRRLRHPHHPHSRCRRACRRSHRHHSARQALGGRHARRVARPGRGRSNATLGGRLSATCRRARRSRGDLMFGPGGVLFLLRHEMLLTWRNFRASGKGRNVRRAHLLYRDWSRCLGFGGYWARADFCRSSTPHPDADHAWRHRRRASRSCFTLMLVAGADADHRVALSARRSRSLARVAACRPGASCIVRMSAIAINVGLFYLILSAAVFVWLPILRRLGLDAALRPACCCSRFSRPALRLVLARLLFAAIGPKNTRMVAQILASLIGAASSSHRKCRACSEDESRAQAMRQIVRRA